jgi:hypothetical protein
MPDHFVFFIVLYNLLIYHPKQVCELSFSAIIKSFGRDPIRKIVRAHSGGNACPWIGWCLMQIGGYALFFYMATLSIDYFLACAFSRLPLRTSSTSDYMT